MKGKTKYVYRAFGLDMESDFVLDALLPASGPAQVRIIEGEVSAHFLGPAGENAYWNEGRDKFAFRVKEVGVFLIAHGTEIIVQKHEKADADTISLYILGTCMGALLIQRGLVPMHGSSLSVNEKQIIISGVSGAGKSTLTASLNQLGYAFLADDISALQIEENGDAWIMPAFPKQKLCRDTAIRILGGVEGLERIPGIRDKYHAPQLGPFLADSRKLCALFEISTHSGTQVELEEVKGTEKLAVLMRNTFRFQLVELKGLGAEHFRQCSKIASRIGIYKIRRPENGFTVEEQIHKIMKVLDQM